jgi:cbb3-type cytochrome oxidase subunit 1
MDWFTRAFIRSSVAWLAAGVTLGVLVAAVPGWIVYRPAHMHMNLLGFVAMMIFGVAYHVLPRFASRPLHDRRLAVAHWWLANGGLVLMVAGFILRAGGWVPLAASTACLATGGTASALGAYAFAYNVWRTLGAAGPARAGASAPTSPPDATLRLARRA